MGKPDTLPLLTRCVKATHSLPAAILLYRICYWQTHAKVERKGHVWIAKAREEWMVETGLSLQQYKRSVSELRSLNLVETEKHYFRQRQVTYTRLLSRGKMLLSGHEISLEADDALAQNQADVGLEIEPTQGSISSHSYEQGDTKGDTKGDTSAGPAGHGEKTPIADDCTPGYGADGKEAETVSSIADKLKSPTKKPKSLTGKPDTLPEVWLKVRAEQTGTFQPPMTAVKKGQLKHLEKFCPPGKAEEIMVYIMKEWAMFVGMVKSSAGINNVPAEPIPGFLLTHVAIAIQFWETMTSKPKVSYVGNKVILDPLEQKAGFPVKPIAAKGSSKKMSKAEWDAIMSGEDE